MEDLCTRGGRLSLAGLFSHVPLESEVKHLPTSDNAVAISNVQLLRIIYRLMLTHINLKTVF